MTDQVTKRQKLLGGTYNGGIISVNNSYSIEIVDDEIVVKEVTDFRVPKRSVFFQALHKSNKDFIEVGNGLKFGNVSKSVINEFKLHSWDLDFDTSEASVNVYFGAEIEGMVVRCQLQFMSEGRVEREGRIMIEKGGYRTTIGDTDATEYKYLVFCDSLAGFWMETTDQIRVILTFPSPIELHPPPPLTEVDGNEANVPPFEVYFLSDDFSDISVSSNDEKWPAHKIVLAHSSEVLKRMVQTEMKETQEGNIKLDEFDPRAVKEMLRFMYTGKLEATPEITLDIFKLAHTYAIKKLKKRILPQILSSVTVETAPDMYYFGELYDVKMVIAQALSIAKANKKCLVEDDKQLKTLMETHPKFIYQLFLS